MADLYDEIENDSDTLIRAVKNIITASIVIVGSIYLVCFWLANA